MRRLPADGCTVLYCTVLHCTVLYCTVLFLMARMDDEDCASRWLSPGEVRGLVEIQTKVHPKVRNHRESPYSVLLLVESGYYRFHI